MHEMSIVCELLDVVRRELAVYPDAHVRTVRVRIGSLRQVVPDMLQFAYEAASCGTDLDGSQIEIESVPAVARCDVCSLQFAVEENWFECPRCQSARGRLIAGSELELVDLDIEQPQANAAPTR